MLQMNKIIATAKKAYVHNFIIHMSNGYDIIIEEGGENLS